MKYNLSEVMKRAWEIVKKANVSFSLALKFSWTCAKKAVELKMAEHRENNPTCNVNFSIWAKFGKLRAYYRCNWWSKYSNGKSYNFIEM